jgi:hypothetical protein
MHACVSERRGRERDRTRERNQKRTIDEVATYTCVFIYDWFHWVRAFTVKEQARGERREGRARFGTSRKNDEKSHRNRNKNKMSANVRLLSNVLA